VSYNMPLKIHTGKGF